MWEAERKKKIYKSRNTAASGKELMFRGAGEYHIECNGADADDARVCKRGMQGGTRCDKSPAKTVTREAASGAAAASSEPCTAGDNKSKRGVCNHEPGKPVSHPGQQGAGRGDGRQKYRSDIDASDQEYGHPVPHPGQHGAGRGGRQERYRFADNHDAFVEIVKENDASDQEYGHPVPHPGQTVCMVQGEVVDGKGTASQKITLPLSVTARGEGAREAQ